MKFEEFGLSHNLLTTIDKLGFTQPTQIQERSIPTIIKGKDVIGESATGSGKTLAFGCSIAENVQQGKGIQALVLTPTRELAEQVKDMLHVLEWKLKIIPIYGGVSIDRQFHELETADVVVATPGRLLDHLQRRTIDLSKVNILVLDEADRMFDMGFIDDVERIIRICPKKRQTLFFSATISTRVKALAKKHMENPKLVAAQNMVDPSKLKQIYYDVHKNKKLSLLIHLLKNEKSDLVMVFCNTRRNTDFVVKNLKANDINATAIHGGLSQNKRTNTIKSFNDTKREVLVCTDVAARGLHIDNVSHVYNYDIPNDPKEYVHRIGRTARAGEKGKVINVLCDMDHSNFSNVMVSYREFNIEKTPIPALGNIKIVKTEDRRSGGFSRGRNSYNGHLDSGRRPGYNQGRRGRNNAGRSPRSGSGRRTGNRPQRKYNSHRHHRSGSPRGRYGRSY